MSAEQAFFLTSTVRDRGRNRGGHWSSSVEHGADDYDEKKLQKWNATAMASSWAAAMQEEMAYGGLAAACDGNSGRAMVATTMRGAKAPRTSRSCPHLHSYSLS